MSYDNESNSGAFKLLIVIGAVVGLVRLKTQRIVFTILCGPLVWFFKSVGWFIDFLDYIFAGFKEWLYKKEEIKK